MVYHFDYRHNGALIRDDEGTALVSLDQARKEAVRALVEFAKDEVQAWETSQLAIEVRESGQLVLQVVLTVEIKQFR
jgi:hypothetical protein